MSLSLIFSNFKKLAHQLYIETGIKYDATPAKIVIGQLLDGYCKAKDTNDEHFKDLYIAGLILRFWYVIKKYKESCPGIGLEDVDFLSWLYEAIEYACKYRAWQKNTKVNAQQCVNQCIETIRKQHYYEFNLDKHRANYNKVSMETSLSEDDKLTLEDTLPDMDSMEQFDSISSNNFTRSLIQNYVNNNKIVEAIILDTIAFTDSQKLTKSVHKYTDSAGVLKKYTHVDREFWPYKVVQCLSKLSDDYEQYFKQSYTVSPEKFEAAFNALKKATNGKLYKYLDKTLADAKTRLQNSF